MPWGWPEKKQELGEGIDKFWFEGSRKSKKKSYGFGARTTSAQMRRLIIHVNINKSKPNKHIPSHYLDVS